MRNEVQIKHFEKTYKNLNLLKYDHEVYRIIAFIYSVFSYSLDYSDLDENNVHFTIRYKYPSIKRIRILLIYEKLHYSMQIYTTVFLIVYMYLYTVVQYSYTMLSDSMNIPHSEVSTYINQYYLFTSLSIYYYGYVHVMCFYCSEGNTGNGGRSRNLFFHPEIYFSIQKFIFPSSNHMSNMEYTNELPFYSTRSNDLNELYKNKIQKTNAFECNNNDFFADIDPDLNFINHANKNSSYYTIKEFQKEYYNNKERKNNLSLFHTNIRSSSHKKINDLKCYLSTLGIEFSIIGLTENWGKQHNIDLRNLSGYKHHYFIRLNRSGGGVSLYVKNCLPHKQRIDIANNDNIFESLFIEIDKKEFDTHKNIVIGLIYKPPNTPVKQFNEKLEKLLSLIQIEKNMHIYLETSIFVQKMN